jgi:hypothetical protein
MRFGRYKSFRDELLVGSLRSITFALCVISASCGGSGGGDSISSPSQQPPANTAPIVDAGADAKIRLPEETLDLDATVTDDGLPSNTLAYAWSVSSGPDGATFADARAEDTTVTFALAGTYVLQLTATDSELEASDAMQVTVEAAPKVSTLSVTPTSVTLMPGETQFFTASATDQYGDPFVPRVEWAAGGGTIDQEGNFTAGNRPGNFTVTAASEAVSDTATVTVIASAPAADAGGPYTGAQGTTIALDGSGSSDPNDDIVSYDWDLDGDGVFADASGITATYASARAGVFSIGLRVSDAKGASDTATTTVTVINLAPLATPLSVSTAEDTLVPIILSGSDPGGDPLTCAVVAPPANGTLKGVEPELIYTPNPDFNGTDSFSYIVNDGELNSRSAVVSITVSSVNDPPVAYDQSSTAVAGESVALLLKYSDVDGPGPYTLQVVTAPESGSVSAINPDGSILYTPDPGFTGTDRFEWAVNDGLVDSAEATATVAVEALPPAGIYFPPAGESLSSQSYKSPAEVGLGASVVADLAAVITAGRWALWRHGYLVHVDGDFNDNDEVKSLRKIIHAATVGVAIQRGFVPSLDQAISAWNPELTGVDATATWAHVMTQTSAFDEPTLAPGSLWAYSDANPLQLCRAIARVWGRGDYTDRYDLVVSDALFDAIGARGWSSFPAADGIRFLFDLEDLGRAGLLFVAGGEWNGHRLIPLWFVEELGTKQTYGILPNYDNENDGHTGLQVEDFTESPYGLMTWVNTDRDLYPNSSAEWVVALGVGGHYLVYNRKSGLVLAVIDGDFVPIDGNPPGWPTPVRIAIEVLEQAVIGPNPMVEGTLPSQ